MSGNNIPTDVLLVRALSHFERAQLELAHVPAVSREEAILYIEKGIKLVRQVLES